jgi:branched-subunit amino acid transport protein AzlD
VPDTGYLLAVVGVAAATTLALRAAPFALRSALRSSPLVDDLGRRLPAAVMVILVLYLLRDVPLTAVRPGLGHLGAIAVTVGVHLWRGRALLSIAAGTAVYAVLLAVLPG